MLTQGQVHYTSAAALVAAATGGTTATVFFDSADGGKLKVILPTGVTHELEVDSDGEIAIKP
jgi:hypothetical protein